MPQSQIQEQRQEQRQVQTISAQQLLQSQLIELPLQQMVDRIETELHDNPALEKTVGEEEPAPWETTDMGDSPEAMADRLDDWGIAVIGEKITIGKGAKVDAKQMIDTDVEGEAK